VNPPDIRSYDPELLRAWKEGVEEFNQGRFWHAHECWERGWKGLPEPERTWVQACIQVAGVLHLLEKGRIEPALSLAASAQAKFGRTLSEMEPVFPRIEIAGAGPFLDSPERTSVLKAALLLHPPL
jgi:hypothetical protein